jgi:Zn-dependent protease
MSAQVSQFVVPAGASAGQQIRVTTAEGKTVHVRVPEGVRPGQTVSIHTDPGQTPFTAFDFQKNAVGIGSIQGIPIRVHPTFFLILALQAFMGLGSAGGVGFAYCLIIYGPVLFSTILIHELGHSLMTQRLGGSVDQILLWPLGGLAFCGGTSNPREDLKVAIAGPATHFPQLLFWMIMMAMGGSVSLGAGLADGFWSAVCSSAMRMQIALFCFNLLLPAYPLDGGRVLAALLVIRKGKSLLGNTCNCALLFSFGHGPHS